MVPPLLRENASQMINRESILARAQIHIAVASVPCGGSLGGTHCVRCCSPNSCNDEWTRSHARARDGSHIEESQPFQRGKRIGGTFFIPSTALCRRIPPPDDDVALETRFRCGVTLVAVVIVVVGEANRSKQRMVFLVARIPAFRLVSCARARLCEKPQKASRFLAGDQFFAVDQASPYSFFPLYACSIFGPSRM